MSLIRTAQLNGHDPYADLNDVLNRLPTHRADDIAALLPHRWALAVALPSLASSFPCLRRALTHGRCIRMLTIIDAWNRECPHIEVEIKHGLRRLVESLTPAQPRALRTSP